ncbi:DUF5806 family protein [Haloferax namakaokahaiae]|uniref:DUF5806 family protein n=1 Tax=Haloferax namakaokahaiae TaxID=1748331 RepID=A0ABD5ZCM9_9EURY
MTDDAERFDTDDVEPEGDAESSADAESGVESAAEETAAADAAESEESVETVESGVGDAVADEEHALEDGDTVGQAPEAAESSSDADDSDGDDTDTADEPSVPDDVQKYARFKKVDGAQYDRVNDFLRDRTYVTAREWAIARLCADFRTETGVEMTKIGNNLPELVPFMTDTYTPQAVNQARSAFRDKVRKSGATFLYGAMSGFFTAEELDEMMYEVTEIAKFLLEVEGVDLSVEEELEAEERISSVMREVREASEDLRADELATDN